MTLYLTFFPTMNDKIKSALPKGIRVALRSHKALFYQGGLTLSVTSSILTPPAFIFQMALLSLLSLDKTSQVPTPTEIPRRVFDVIANVRPNGHTLQQQRLLVLTEEDPLEIVRLPP